MVTKGKSGRIDFALLCLFVLSQAYTVPLFTVGPSWAVWPTAGDIVLAAMIPVVVFRMVSGTGRKTTEANRRILVLLLVLLAACACSYLILCRAMPDLYRATSGRATQFGEYQIYRIVQGVLAYFFASQIELTPRRTKILSIAAATALAIVCAALFLEYLRIIPASTYARHLPKSLLLAGPWGYYAVANQPEGYGTISYTHAYSSSQVLLLLVLCLLLSPAARNFTKAAFVFVAEAAIFASGCRAVLAGSLVLLAALFIRRPRVLAGFACILVAVAALTAGLAPSLPDLLRPAVDRAAALNPLGDMGAQARLLLWSDQVQYLNEQPLRWIIGAGFGTSAGSTGNDNILFLQIINETGLLGLAAFMFVIWEICRRIHFAGPNSRPMLFGTIAILVASVGQETLYPVPAMGQFIAFYTLCLALALRPVRRPVKWVLFVPGPVKQRALSLTGMRQIEDKAT